MKHLREEWKRDRGEDRKKTLPSEGVSERMLPLTFARVRPNKEKINQPVERRNVLKVVKNQTRVRSSKASTYYTITALERKNGSDLGGGRQIDWSGPRKVHWPEQ